MFINQDTVDYDEAAILGQCTYCGDPNDYCLGHGDITDPPGFEALIAHDQGDHTLCHQDGCRYAPKPKHERIIMHAQPRAGRTYVVNRLGELVMGVE